MKKYLVIGNPIKHSLSPKLHNYWIKQNNIDAIYEKKNIIEKELESVITNIRDEKIHGINVTVPYKQKIISFLDNVTPLAEEARSVNTIYKENNNIIGDNTDITGFDLAIKNSNYELKNKKIFILGAGGVSPSIIVALRKNGVSKIILGNRTREKAEYLKKQYPEIEIVNWGETPKADLIINATSLGLKKEDKIELNYSEIGPNKLFYDVIYNPKQTNFLLEASKFGNKILNGKMMFIYQAQRAFFKWHNILPKIDENVINLLDQ